MFGHFEPVNHCCFSPDDALISTSSNDGTVKVIFNPKIPTVKLFHLVLTKNSTVFFAHVQLFNVSSANEWKTINVKAMFGDQEEEVLVKCSTWTPDGKRIVCAARNAVWVRFCFVWYVFWYSYSHAPTH